MNATSNKTLIRRALGKRMPDQANRYKRMFMAPSNASKSVFEGPLAERWLSDETIESCGFYRPRMVRALRNVHGALSPASGIRKVLEGFLMTAISAHMIDHLFCREFSGSLDRFGAARPADPIPGLDQAA